MHETLFKMHAKQRLDKIQNNKPCDWSTAEAVAMGSILLSGSGVRFCGEDVRRGTFSHRHASLTCQQTEDQFVPLNQLSDQHKLEVKYFLFALSIL